ncbi:hypothetical protein HMPREF1439_01533 [Helicobacter pylori HP250AFiii]|nr:hypothetical protein HMPREF1438_01572 [Helicobacter pylori HP250AFii]EMH46339.1 hypothetical protein HMPREF1439_01533 [Helicobacter pylori HP250AFiii]EMH50558.1 hypothetical protein HMPREF1440_01353 [Helicobacter pylori HP250AFiV]
MFAFIYCSLIYTLNFLKILNAILYFCANKKHGYNNSIFKPCN